MEISAGLAVYGATVCVNGRDERGLATRYKNLIDLGYDAKPAHSYATNVKTVDRFLDSTEIPIDILVRNAAIRLRKSLVDTSPKSFFRGCRGKSKFR